MPDDPLFVLLAIIAGSLTLLSVSYATRFVTVKTSFRNGLSAAIVNSGHEQSRRYVRLNIAFHAFKERILHAISYGLTIDNTSDTADKERIFH